jgi:hypothetical protein
VAEEGRGENEVVQPVNPSANAATNAAANLRPTSLLMPQATSPTMQLMLLVPNQTSPPTQGKMRELSLRQYKPTMMKGANVYA